MNVVQHFFDNAESTPKQVALIEGSKQITFGELRDEVISTANYFQKLGLNSGDRVLVAVPMSIDLYRSVLAIFYMGAIAVFADEWVNAKRLNLLCLKADCKALIASPKVKLLSYFFKGTRSIAIKLSLRKRVKGSLEMFSPSENDSALITFTTGSTGEPKAADRTHKFLNEQFRVLNQVVDLKKGGVDMPVLPIVLFLNLGAGRTSVIVKWKASKPHALNTQEVLSQIEKHQVKSITASPSFLRILSQAQVSTNSTDIISEIYTGGAPVFKKDALLFKKAFPKSKSTVIYGSTEAEPISTVNLEELMLKDISLDGGLFVGEIHEELELLIKNVKTKLTHKPSLDQFKSCLLKEGEVGEILVSGDHVLKRYFKSENAFQENKIIVDGKLWHKTGDSGFVKSNSLYLTGRVKQIFTHAGNIYLPFVIEHEILEVDGIVQGTIIKRATEILLCYEGDINPGALNVLMKKYSVSKLVKLTKIPMDKRHHSKIDYTALQTLVS